MRYDVIVIGGSIAGLTATLYLLRQGVKTLVITKDFGGQLKLAKRIENYPGFLIISGNDLISKIEQMLKKFENFEYILDEVVSITKQENLFRIKTKSGREFESYAIIIASGKKPKSLNVPGEFEFIGKGVSYCVICDAPLYRGKLVAYIVEDEQLFEVSINMLIKYASKIYVITSRDSIIQKLPNIDKIELIKNAKVLEIKGDNQVKSIVIKDQSNNVRELQVDGVFIELGFELSTEFVKDLVKLNERGEIVIDKYCKTSCEGIFAAGDVTDILYKQAIIAAGLGAIAALSTCEYLYKIGILKTYKIRDWTISKEFEEKKIRIKL